MFRRLKQLAMVTMGCATAFVLADSGMAQCARGVGGGGTSASSSSSFSPFVSTTSSSPFAYHQSPMQPRQRYALQRQIMQQRMQLAEMQQQMTQRKTAEQYAKLQKQKKTQAQLVSQRKELVDQKRADREQKIVALKAQRAAEKQASSVASAPTNHVAANTTPPILTHLAIEQR